MKPTAVPRTPIFLIGYMGTGKSTLGGAVARLGDIRFIDLDHYIEGRFHRSVSQLFEERGEDGFRKVEQAMLHEVGEFEDVIIACGGGTPCFFDNMDYMNSRGLTILLEAPLPCLCRRLWEGRRKRPLIKGMQPQELAQFITSNMEARMPFYSKAKLTFPSGELETPQQINTNALKFIQLTGIPPA